MSADRISGGTISATLLVGLQAVFDNLTVNLANVTRDAYWLDHIDFDVQNSIGFFNRRSFKYARRSWNSQFRWKALTSIRDRLDHLRYWIR